MAVIALVLWLTTAGGGLYLLAVWLIEYDREFQAAKATRLPVPVIGTHALLAVAGLVVWSAYLLLDNSRLAWTAVAILAVVAGLGLIMAMRWFQARRAALASTPGGPAAAFEPVPPERNFPLPVVIGHGVLAVATIAAVVLTATGAGGG